jgi:methyltransferase (TIGR00027 family)
VFTGLGAIVYRVANLEAAKQWYQKVLGKPPVFDSPIVVVFMIGDVMLNLTPAEGSAPAREPQDDQASQSALGVTLFRAFATRDTRPEIRGHDDLAEKFLPEELRTMVNNPAAREWVIAKAPGSYEYFIARTAFFDAAVREALDENLPQIVFLGAGYDSRAYRFADRIRDTRVFELDVPSTQQRKKAMLQQAGVRVPAGLDFVPINFTRDSLDDVLAKAGFDRSKQTLYIWEGVTYYLPAAAVDETLAFIRRNSPAGSRLCLDYMIDAPDMASRYGVAQSRALMRDTYRAEPIQFRVPEGTLEAFLAERGYATVEHLMAGDLEKNYLTLASGALAGKVLACFGLVRATVEG